MPFNVDEFFALRPLILAPLAGVSDEALRQLCIEQGAQLTYSEMVSAKGLQYANERTRRLLSLAPNEQYIAVQLFGHEPDTMAFQAASIRESLGERLAYIDINMGCPAKKIVSKGDGSALMDTPELAEQIVRRVVNSVDCPVGVKFRRGIRIDEELCVDYAKRMEQAGCSIIALHGRFAHQYYHGKADWDCIKRVKQAVQTYVIGNGDVVDGKSASALLETTNCDAIMVGRAATGNPWVFNTIRHYFKQGSEAQKPTIEQRMQMAQRHAQLLSERGEKTLVRMRKHATWYMTGLPNASVYRNAVNQCITLEDFNKLFERIVKDAT